MTTEYFRPETMEQALELLARPDAHPLGGGTYLNTPNFVKPEALVVVDLQSLGLKKIHKTGHTLEIGATVTLQQLLDNEHTPAALKQAIRLESAINIRSMATVAGTLVSGDGRSTFATAMLALDAKLTLNGESASLGEFLPLRPRGLITLVSIPLNAALAFEQVARTPADLPIVCAALAQWSSGRARLALGGYGKAPLLAMDGTESAGLESAAKNAFHEASDPWASAEYRMDVAATLARRCLEKLASEK